MRSRFFFILFIFSFAGHECYGARLDWLTCAGRRAFAALVGPWVRPLLRKGILEPEPSSENIVIRDPSPRSELQPLDLLQNQGTAFQIGMAGYDAMSGTPRHSGPIAAYDASSRQEAISLVLNEPDPPESILAHQGGNELIVAINLLLNRVIPNIAPQKSKNLSILRARIAAKRVALEKLADLDALEKEIALPELMDLVHAGDFFLLKEIDLGGSDEDLTEKTKRVVGVILDRVIARLP